jgi:dTDP-6-deoxy-L-talose 4-dehydrogenase (NAD+)
MKRILLTGATGFVGRHVVAELAGRGIVPSVVIRSGTSDRLDDTVATVFETPDLFAEPVSWWAERMTSIDLVVHLAWIAEPGRYLLDPRNLDCLAGTLTMARAAMVAGVARFVGAGTCLEYATSSGDLAPDSPLAPETPYAAAKAAAYTALNALLPPSGVGFLWARLFHIYGPGEDPRRLIAYLHARLGAGQPADLGSGQAVRDFIDVRDAARMIVDDALSDRIGACNIATGTGKSVRAMAEAVADQYGRRDLLRFGARPDRLDDPLRIVAATRASDGPVSASSPLQESVA